MRRLAFLVAASVAASALLLAQQPAGVPLAIVGNGFVATGLMAAAMFFYRERLTALETAKVGQADSRMAGKKTDQRDDRR